MDEHYCLYALTWADCPVNSFGPGVDPRFAVELVRYGRLAALTSRVGLDQFDLAKLQEGTADFPWLSKVAVRHNEIIVAVARHLPVLPMRLGIFFESRSSLIAKLTPYEANAAEFLQHLEDRQEWAVKIYVDESRCLQRPTNSSPTGRRGPGEVRNTWLPKDYRRSAVGRSKPRSDSAVLTVEARLQGITDAWHRLRPLPATLTNRPEKMVWNGAFLLSRSNIISFQTACERLRGELAPKGLLVELTGPWPPYHFCPSFEPQDEDSPCRCTC